MLSRWASMQMKKTNWQQPKDERSMLSIANSWWVAKSGNVLPLCNWPFNWDWWMVHWWKTGRPIKVFHAPIVDTQLAILLRSKTFCVSRSNDRSTFNEDVSIKIIVNCSYSGFLFMIDDYYWRAWSKTAWWWLPSPPWPRRWMACRVNRLCHNASSCQWRLSQLGNGKQGAPNSRPINR